jgi:threonyl-tRNA synthetase
MSTRRISVVHVRPLDSSALGEGARGAYANILANADSNEQYEAVVRAEMAEQQLFVVDFDAIRPITPEVLADCEEEIHELASQISDQHPVQYRTFDTYYTDDA